MEKLLKPKSEQLLNEAVKDELFAEHTYKFLAAKMQAMGFKGLQGFFEKEMQSECAHYQELRDYMNDMGGIAETPMLEAVTTPIETVQAALMLAYDTEKYLLEKYEERAAEVMKHNDYATFHVFLHFIEKQVKSVGEYGDLLNLLYKDPAALITFDNYVKNL